MEVDRTQSAKSRKNNEREFSDCRVAQIHNKPRRSARVLLFVYRASDARLAKMLPVSDGFCYQWLQCARQTAEIIVMLKVILILHNNECDPELWDEVKRTKIIKKKKDFQWTKRKAKSGRKIYDSQKGISRGASDCDTHGYRTRNEGSSLTLIMLRKIQPFIIFLIYEYKLSACR